MSGFATIKVTRRVYEAVVHAARTEGLTVSEFLELVIAEHARSQGFAAFHDAYSSAGPDRAHDEIGEAWDSAVGDGLADA